MNPFWAIFGGTILTAVGTIALILLANRRQPLTYGNAKGNDKDVFQAFPDEICCICQQPMNINARTNTLLNCGHYLHEECYRQLRRHSKKCPICSRNFDS